MDHSHYLHVQVHVSSESARDTFTAKWNGNGFRSPGKTILVAIESSWASCPGLRGSRRSVKRERRLSRERENREGEDDCEEEDTAQAFCIKYHNFSIFQAIFFIHTTKTLHCSNFSKMYELQKLIECFLFYAQKTSDPDF